MEKVRSFLKWPGNKYRCLNTILPILKPAERLIEVFAGSATIFCNTNYNYNLVAEVNLDLVNLFNHLKQEGDDFIYYCKSFFVKENNLAERYYDLRNQFNNLPYNHVRAGLFLYLNRHGYNGLCRYNLSNKYNVPFGRYFKPYFPLKEMKHFYQKSKQALFLHADFRDTFLHANRGDIIYCDPPYSPLIQNSNFSAYSNQKFGEKEHIDLTNLAKSTANKGICVIISNHDTPFTRDQYRHAKVYSFPVKRQINCKAHQRHHVQEILAVFS